MWTYEQATGKLLDSAGNRVAQGYAGNGVGKNNPEMENVHDVGPLPCGVYTIGAPHNSPNVGPYAMNLAPDLANEMFGRGDFRIHGDSKSDPGNASHGCIVMPRTVREAIWNSGVRTIQVVA